MTFSVMSV